MAKKPKLNLSELPFHASFWKIRKINKKILSQNEELYYENKRIHSSMHRVEFFYKPITRISKIFYNEE